MPTQKMYHASCLCKTTKFTLEGEPFHFTICHCINCKHSSGSAFLSHALFKAPQFIITKGEELITSYKDSDNLSGNTITRAFCSKCGSPLFLKPAKEGIIIVHPGQIKEPVTWAPKKELHGDKKLPWLKEITIQKKKPAKL